MANRKKELEKGVEIARKVIQQDESRRSGTYGGHPFGATEEQVKRLQEAHDVEFDKPIRKYGESDEAYAKRLDQHRDEYQSAWYNTAGAVDRELKGRQKRAVEARRAGTPAKTAPRMKKMKKMETVSKSGVQKAAKAVAAGATRGLASAALKGFDSV